MRDVEVKLNCFKLKKLAALAMCAVMAIGVMTIPVHAVEESNTPTQLSYTGDANNSMPESFQNLMRKRVQLSDGSSVGLDYQIFNIVNYYRDDQAIIESQWTEMESAMNKAFEAIVEREIKFSGYNGKNVDDHHAYVALMTDIVKVLGGKITYDGGNKVTTEFNGTVKSIQTYTNYTEIPAWMATGDAKDPSKVIDFIKNTDSNFVTVELNEEAQSMSKSVFQAAKESGKELTFRNKDENGNSIEFSFEDGIKNDVDMNFGIKTAMDNDLVKNLKDERALVFEFAHEGVLPGLMQVRFYNEAYQDQIEVTAFLYLLNSSTGKLEKQEQPVKIDHGWVTFAIDHCSSYVTTLTEIDETKLQVADAKADEKADEKPSVKPDVKPAAEEDKNDTIKQTGSESNAFQTIALLTLCGAAIVIATKKEKKVQ